VISYQLLAKCRSSVVFDGASEEIRLASLNYHTVLILRNALPRCARNNFNNLIIV